MTAQKKRVLAVITASIIMSAIRTVTVSFFMEKNDCEINAYYLPENLIVIGFAVMTVLFLAVFAVAAAMLGRKKTFVLEHNAASVSVSSLILAFALVGEVVVYTYSFVKGYSIIRSLGLVIIALSIACAVVFFSNVSAGFTKKRSEKMIATLALIPIFLSAFRLLGDFIRTNAMPLASSGAYHLMGLTALLLYFLCEGKSYASKVSAAVYYFFGFSAVFLLMIYAVPNIAMFCFGGFEFNYYSGFSIVDLAAAVYICCRLSNTVIAKRECEEAADKNPTESLA